MSRQHHRYDETLEAAAIAGFAQGERAERERIRSILESPEAVGREGAAIFIATKTDIPARAALMILDAAPRAASPAFNVRPLRYASIKIVFNSGSQNV
jgi:hypothetical protein